MTLTRTAPGIYTEGGKWIVVMDEFAASQAKSLQGLSMSEIQKIDIDGLIRDAAFDAGRDIDFVERIRTRGEFDA